MNAMLLTLLENHVGLDEPVARKALAVIEHWDSTLRGTGTLDRFFGLCESPIERRFLLAATTTELELRCVVDDTVAIFDVPIIPGLAMHVRPQSPAQSIERDARLDFEIVAVLGARRSAPLCVELDGHDFHERTKQQATRDKSRDRMLSLAGYTVFRFTGSEVFIDARRCWADVIKFAKRWAAAEAPAPAQETENGTTSGPTSSSTSNEGSGHE